METQLKTPKFRNPTLWQFFDLLLTMVLGPNVMPEHLRGVDVIEILYDTDHIEVLYHDADGSRGSFTHDIVPAAWIAFNTAFNSQMFLNTALTFELEASDGNYVKGYLPAATLKLKH